MGAWEAAQERAAAWRMCCRHHKVMGRQVNRTDFSNHLKPAVSSPLSITTSAALLVLILPLPGVK
jgi:hypothetical protein